MFECDTNCVDCLNYYACDRPTKLEEETRNFWLDEREQEYNSQFDEYDDPYYDEEVDIEPMI